MKDNYTRAHMALGINIIPHFPPHGKCGQIKIPPGQQSKAGAVSEKSRRDARRRPLPTKTWRVLARITFNEAVCFRTAQYSIPLLKGCYAIKPNVFIPVN